MGAKGVDSRQIRQLTDGFSQGKNAGGAGYCFSDPVSRMLPEPCKAVKNSALSHIRISHKGGFNSFQVSPPPSGLPACQAPQPE